MWGEELQIYVCMYIPLRSVYNGRKHIRHSFFLVYSLSSQNGFWEPKDRVKEEKQNYNSS